MKFRMVKKYSYNLEPYYIIEMKRKYWFGWRNATAYADKLSKDLVELSSFTYDYVDRNRAEERFKDLIRLQMKCYKIKQTKKKKNEICEEVNLSKIKDRFLASL